MWTMLLLLWMIPLAIGVLILGRMAAGLPPLTKKERELFFDETKQCEIRPWPAATFVVFAVIFCSLGLVQGIVLPNLNDFWFFLAPLLTGGSSILILVHWLRAAGHPSPRKSKNRLARMHARASRLAAALFR